MPHVPSTPVSCPSPQPSVQALRERTEQLFLRSGACAVQLEHAQSLLAQFSEAHEELLPWLEETQVVGVQLSPNAISYEAFKEQQALLQVRAGWPQPGHREGEGEGRDMRGREQRRGGAACGLRQDGGGTAAGTAALGHPACRSTVRWEQSQGSAGVHQGTSPRALTWPHTCPRPFLCPQCLREAIAEHRPLMGKLQRVSAQLVELSPEQGAPFQQRWQEAEEQYGRIRERVRQAAALLEDALPRYSQVRDRQRGVWCPLGLPLK